ncbi:MAG TPA: selenocysteine-specific translation elongation factor [Actinomycetota bacterium]|nr:selenocysteine-specific translation elongation factor [Actinomycetota bacterium]
MESAPAAAEPLHVVATAGHVDHGKSSLIVRLTGIDPDRWEEEKRRGLTIDLGFAWCTLPSGREIGFVDVPGHERFVRNMLAGVGPLRLVLFVVAADEGWKPQSEEHLAIVDVLGAQAGVVALTKRDLVDEETLGARMEEIRARLAGTTLEDAPLVACSAQSGEGLGELREELDRIVGEAPPPEDAGRPRIHIDRSFTIRGAGTVVTGTLTGGTLSVGDEVVLHPDGTRARIRSLQTHRRPVPVARPVSRVAANLVGTSKEDVERGDVLARPGQWRPTALVEARLRPVRGIEHPLTARGAYKLYVGAAERDARLRLYDRSELLPGGTVFGRLRLSRPVVVDVGDRFVLREAGRRETVAGGVILDADPPARPGPDPASRLSRREGGDHHDIPVAVVSDRGAIRASELRPVAGSSPSAIRGAARVGEWWVSEEALGSMRDAALAALADEHRRNPLRPGIDASEIKPTLMRARPDLTAQLEQGLGAEVLDLLEAEGVVARQATTVRLPDHRVTLGDREPEAEQLTKIVAEAEPTPPTVKDLEGLGYEPELIEASVMTERLVRVSAEIVVTPPFLARAEEIARSEAARPDGLTVSRFRELLGTTRKYALPLLGYLDDRGVTRRDGDVRRLNG